MARIELKNTSIFFQDGLSGSAAVNNVAGYTAGASQILIDTVVTNNTPTTKIPVGARFTIAAETGNPIHTITIAAETTTDITDDITFTPVLAGAISDDDPIVILPQRIEITVGEGNVTYTESREFQYDLDRGNLDTVREGDDQPVQLSLAVTFQSILTGTGEVISPRDALNGTGGAATWITAGVDECEKYAIDVIILHTVTCGSKEDETLTFPGFRYESFVPDYQAAAIAVQGRCNVTEPTVTRT